MTDESNLEINTLLEKVCSTLSELHVHFRQVLEAIIIGMPKVALSLLGIFILINLHNLLGTLFVYCFQILKGIPRFFLLHNPRNFVPHFVFKPTFTFH